jgi:hypothetical protein
MTKKYRLVLQWAVPAPLTGFGILLLCSALTACGARTAPIPASATPPTEIPVETPALVIPSLAPTGAPTSPPPTETPTIEPTAIPLEPLATAPAVRFDGWSPDGDWLAYWISTDEDVSGNFYPFPPGRLNLHNVRTGQECLYDELLASQEGDRVIWQPDGELVVSIADRYLAGAPCQGDLVTAETPGGALEATRVPTGEASTPEGDVQTSLSPEGSYQAETRVMDRSAGTINLTTTILALPDRQVVNTVDWKIDERLGELGMGGEWLAGNQFLIYETLDRGPLLITVSGEMIEVARQLFGIDPLPSIMDEQGVSLRAAGSAVAGSDTYHIVLYGVGSESNFPPVRLYHSDDGQVEEMPFRDPWPPGFSTDGRWLLLDEHPTQDGFETHALWIRPVDPPGSQLRFFAAGSIPAAWSPDTSRAAFLQPGSVSVYIFPEGKLLGSWAIEDYETLTQSWSPQGDSLALLAGVPGEWQQALFVIPFNR